MYGICFPCRNSQKVIQENKVVVALYGEKAIFYAMLWTMIIFIHYDASL